MHILLDHGASEEAQVTPVRRKTSGLLIHSPTGDLRDLNERAWGGDGTSTSSSHRSAEALTIVAEVFDTTGSFDSSLKKNTAFIKRLRTAITASSTATFLQEIRTLSLHKYLSEVISACYEGLSKVKLPGDIIAGVEVFSALHQRFGPADFTTYVAWHIGRGLSSPDKSQLKALPQDVREREEKDRLVRHRILLRVCTELWLVGALRSLDDIARPEEAGKAEKSVKAAPTPKEKPNAGPTKSSSDAEPFPLEVLKELTSHDPGHANLPMIVSWVKAFSWDLLSKHTGDADVAPTDPPMAEDAMQQRFKNVLIQYFTAAKPHLLREQSNLQAQSKRNAEAYVRSGEIFEDRQANFERQSKAQDKFVSNMQVLADNLDLEMPDLREKEANILANDGNIGLVKTAEYLRGVGDGPGIWEDEEERRFYENLVDLKDRVPGILLEDGKKKKADGTDEQVGKKAEDAPAMAEPEVKGDVDGSDQSTAIANKTVGAQVDGLLAKLPDLTSKDLVDQLAMDFCFVNSKASRNRLIRAVQEVPKGRSDLLPLYSRLIATLGKHLTDVSQGLVQHLDEEFRSLQRRKQKDSLGGVRTSNVRYLAELTKFGVVPEHVIFHCLKVSLDDFSKMNIEIICHLLESCGRYLLRNPETAPRMRTFLETLQRKKSAQHLAQQERMLIENAMYYVDPPERAAIEQKERTPTDLFVRKLVYNDLTRRNIEKVIKQIRKLHWEEQEVVDILHKIFAKPHNIRFSNINFLAIILGQLNRYHPDFGVAVMDDLLESITFGLESNDFRYNQRRLAEIRYLGELYLYRLVDSPVIFDTLFKLVTFGHNGWARPGQYTPYDAPDDFFRVRLVCDMLETCGMYFEKGPRQKKMDFFLSYFQYYLQTKETLPMDIEFVVQDAFAAIRPKWKLAATLESAGAAFAEAVKENYKHDQADKAAIEAEETAEMDDEAEDDVHHSPAEDEDHSSDVNDAEAEDEHTPPQTPDAESEEEDFVVTRPEDERDPEAEAEFDREFSKMMAESMETTRKTERKLAFDAALPVRRQGKESGAAADDSGNESPTPAPQSTMKFALLSKKGNRQQVSQELSCIRTQRES